MNIVEQVLQQRGITKTALAEKLGTSKQNMGAILRSPSFPTLEKIATALDIPMYQLFLSPDDLHATRDPVVPAPDDGCVITCPKCGHAFNVDVVAK